MVVTEPGILMAVSPVPSNALTPMCTRDEGRVMDFSEEQFLNTASRIYLVPECRMTVASDVQPSKPPLIVTTFPGISMDVRAVQFLKAPSLISATLLPSVTVVRLVQPAKALLLIEEQLMLASVRLVQF